MARLLPLACLAAAIALLTPCAQAALSQAALQDDCQQRLRPITPREVAVNKVDFSALGNYAQYWVVTLRFDGTLGNGQRSATCTYRREGQWVRDDGAAYKLLLDLKPQSPRRSPAD